MMPTKPSQPLVLQPVIVQVFLETSSCGDTELDEGCDAESDADDNHPKTPPAPACVQESGKIDCVVVALVLFRDGLGRNMVLMT